MEFFEESERLGDPAMAAVEVEFCFKLAAKRTEEDADEAAIVAVWLISGLVDRKLRIER